jgi:hypothetical protein
MLTTATCIDKDLLRYWKGKVDGTQNKKGVPSSIISTFESSSQYDVEEFASKVSEKGATCGF